MKAINNNWPLLVVSVMVIAACIIRLKAYVDPRLSIANNDTFTYISSSEIPILSWEAFKGRRLFTTNLIYNVLKPEGGYEVLVSGTGDTKNRRIQPTFVKIVILQIIFSVICWSIFALTFASLLKNKLLKVLGGLMILLFAFVPQVADWDSLLTSESLTYSLFALQFALLCLLIFRLAKDPAPNPVTLLLVSIWLLTVFFWTFLRDSNLYGVLVDLVMVLSLFLLASFRKQRYLAVIPLVLGGIFLLGWTTFNQSPRGQIAMSEVYAVTILPHPARVEFLQTRGMPQLGSPEYAGWFAAHGKNAYLQFLVHHPGYILKLVWGDLNRAFWVNDQPYFNANTLPWRGTLLSMGDILHPETPTPFYVAVILLMGLIAIAIRKTNPVSGPWAWLAVWLFVFASLNISAVILGDTYGLFRHALLATTSFRFFMWFFLIVLIDLALLPELGNKTDPVPDVAALNTA